VCIGSSIHELTPFSYRGSQTSAIARLLVQSDSSSSSPQTSIPLPSTSPRPTMSGEEDSTREIFGYTSHIPVPVWVEKNAASACKHCSTKFSSMKEQTKPHNCRLCGEMFCTSCTGKYHVPLVYEQKGKKGPTRVCIRCRDSCLKQKESEKNAVSAQQPMKHAVLSRADLSGPTGTSAVRPSQFVGGPEPIEIAPPEWDDAEKFVECAKCHKKGGKPHSQWKRGRDRGGMSVCTHERKDAHLACPLFFSFRLSNLRSSLLRYGESACV
jgi:hypothetical protein